MFWVFFCRETQQNTTGFLFSTGVRGSQTHRDKSAPNQRAVKHNKFPFIFLRPFSFTQALLFRWIIIARRRPSEYLQRLVFINNLLIVFIARSVCGEAAGRRSLSEPLRCLSESSSSTRTEVFLNFIQIISYVTFKRQIREFLGTILRRRMSVIRIPRERSLRFLVCP